MGSTRAACVDVGSTFTKGVLVDLAGGRLLASAEHATTSQTDVLVGLDAVLAALGAGPRDEVLVCSSAGGGLRLAVVGYERVVTAEAGYRAALSAGARVVHVACGRLDRSALAALLADTPDVVLLVGGTDGGDTDVLLHNAAALARSRLRVPLVVAGNVDARAEAVATLAARGKTTVVAANVLPEIGRLAPGPVRAAIRDVFITHVIGGKRLSRGSRFASLVRAATPDAVLAGVELLAADDGDLLVVDVGGATTDVYSVLDVARLEAAETGDVAGTPAALRTVEGDLGVRWSAPGVVAAAVRERLIDPASAQGRQLAEAAQARHGAPALLPVGAAEAAADRALARLALTVALRRHGRTGRDLRRVATVVGSGGVLRHAGSGEWADLLHPAVSDHAGGWRVPERPALAVDVRYVLAAAGLLAAEHPAVATALASAHLEPAGSR